MKMIVDDHNLMNDGDLDAITIRLLPIDVVALLAGYVLTGCNLWGRGTRVRMEMTTLEKATEVKTSLLYVQLPRESIRLLLAGRKMTLPVHTHTISKIVLKVDSHCYPVSSS